MSRAAAPSRLGVLRARRDWHKRRAHPERLRAAVLAAGSWRSGLPPRRLTHPGEIVRCVDRKRRLVYETDGNRHAVFQGAKLLEIFAVFERRWRKRHKSRKRRAPECVDADVVIEIARAGRHAAAAEIERAAV